jgi:cytochrome b561
MLHRSVGLIILAVMLLRAGWRWRHPAPPLPLGLARIEVALLRSTHVLLCLCPLQVLVNVLHLGGQNLIYFFVTLHVAGALLHAIVRRDGVLQRMLPLPRPASAVVGYGRNSSLSRP